MDPQNDIISCPYQPKHRVSRKRLYNHLMICQVRKEKPDKFQNCKYNRLHIIPKAKIQNHEHTCPDKPKVEEFLHRHQQMNENARNLTNIINEWSQRGNQIKVEQDSDQESQIAYSNQRQEKEPEIMMTTFEECETCRKNLDSYMLSLSQNQEAQPQLIRKLSKYHKLLEAQLKIV